MRTQFYPLKEKLFRGNTFIAADSLYLFIAIVYEQQRHDCLQKILRDQFAACGCREGCRFKHCVINLTGLINTITIGSLLLPLLPYDSCCPV